MCLCEMCEMFINRTSAFIEHRMQILSDTHACVYNDLKIKYRKSYCHVFCFMITFSIHLLCHELSNYVCVCISYPVNLGRILLYVCFPTSNCSVIG